MTAEACNCESELCDSGTHTPPTPHVDFMRGAEDRFTRCPEVGDVRIDFLGQVCEACSRHLPNEYLVHGPELPI